MSLAVEPGSAGAELVDELKPSPEVRLDAEALLGGCRRSARGSESCTIRGGAGRYEILADLRQEGPARGARAGGDATLGHVARFNQSPLCAQP